MAKAKFGMIVTDMRNKLGGHVFSKNRSGAIVRTKVTPSNPQTTAQQLARSVLATVSSDWSQLTNAQRASFNNAVEDWKRTDIFGDLKSPSGKNLHSRLNINLINAGLPAVTSAPDKAEIPYMGFTQSIVTNTPGEINSDFSTVPAGYVLQVSATPQLTQGTRYVNGRFRVISYIVAGAVSSATLYDDYVARFGAPAVGANMYLRYVLIADNGQAGVPEQVKVQVLT